MILSIHRSLKDSFRRPSDRTLDRPFLPKDMVMWKGAHSPKDICSSFRLTGHDQKCDVFLGTFEKWHKLLIVKSEISFLQGQLWESIPGLRDINCLLQSFVYFSHEPEGILRESDYTVLMLGWPGQPRGWFCSFTTVQHNRVAHLHRTTPGPNCCSGGKWQESTTPGRRTLFWLLGL